MIVLQKECKNMEVCNNLTQQVNVTRTSLSPARNSEKTVENHPVLTQEYSDMLIPKISTGTNIIPDRGGLESLVWKCSDCGEDFYYYPLVCDDCGCPDFVEVI